MTNPPRPSYAAAGVDVDAAEALISRYAEAAKVARRPEVLADIGPFAGLFELGRKYRDPVLVASTDSVGTKVKLAALLGRYVGLGHDLVNHCVNDILTAGAEPLFFLDYIGNCGLGDDAKVALVRGVAEGCHEAGCALLGGETADMPGTYAEGDFDLVGAIVGVVERDSVIDGSRIEEGNVLIGLSSNGLHTNGYSLVRKIFNVGMGGDQAEERAVLESNYPGLETTLGDALLEHHRSYLNDLRPLLHSAPGTQHLALNGIAHITGGGIPGNVPRILPGGLGARIDRASWRVPAIFRPIQERGGIDDDEMYRAFNMGLGLVLVVAPQDAEAVLARLPDA
ncbi:MAG: phosphoribosylformylglycinamidine cyclo-ligase, partial [Chloroflexi bacterium]